MARRSRPAAVPSVEAKPLDLPGVRRIIVVRESDAANRLLFTEMIVKTVAAFVFRLPSVARLLEIGCDVFDNPEKYGAQVVGSSKARTALFMLDEETLVMFHMGSAALLDGAADDLLADSFLLDGGDEILDHRKRHVGLEQGHSDFAQGLGDVGFGQARFTLERLHDAGKAGGQVIEHGGWASSRICGWPTL